jgi:uncharacterized protein YcfL
MFSFNRIALSSLIIGLLVLQNTLVFSAEAENSLAIKEKLMLRGKNEGIKVLEFRSKVSNDTLVVQADIKNTTKKDLIVFYRFYWMDADGNQVGDDEVWKQVQFYGDQQRTLKAIGVAKSVADFRLEMNVEPPK